MKKILFILLAFLATGYASAQKVNEKDVPESVKMAFHRLYPQAKEIKWEKENGNYEVNFDNNKQDYSVLLDEKGGVVETEVEIEPNQLPAITLEYIKTHYPGKKIKEAAKITDAKGVVTYEAEIKGKDVIFDSTGNFIRESKD